MKRTPFTPSTDPTPPPPTPLLLFIQQAQLALLYPERVEADVEADVETDPTAPNLSDAA